MSRLEAPIRRELAARVDEHAVQRIWSAVRARREGARQGRRIFWGWAFAAAATLVVLGLLGARYFQPAPRGVTSGPLTLRAGAAPSVLGSQAASRSELSDGSAISLDAGSQLEVLENTSKSFVSVLRRGRGAFAVQPGGPRRWTVEAGLLTVEVVGTRFSVTRRESAVDVAVEHGIVLVRSELIRDRVQRLTAGQELTIQLPAPPAAPAPVVEPTPSAQAVTPTPTSVSSSPSPAPSAESSLQGLLTAANEQRRQGDVKGAEASLRRALAEHPSEPQTALVAFTLGKLLLDAAGRPADAAQAFERCLAASPPSALAEDALYRLTQARAQAGDPRGASTSARRYQFLYPNGRYARDVDRWVLAP